MRRPPSRQAFDSSGTLAWALRLESHLSQDVAIVFHPTEDVGDRVTCCAHYSNVLIMQGTEEGLPSMVCGRPKAKAFYSTRTPQSPREHPAPDPLLNEGSRLSRVQARHGMAQKAASLRRNERGFDDCACALSKALGSCRSQITFPECNLGKEIVLR